MNVNIFPLLIFLSWVNSVSTSNKEMCSATAEKPCPELGNAKEWGRA